MARSMVSLGPLVGSGPSINKDTDEVPMGIICNQANSVSGLCISESSTKFKGLDRGLNSPFLTLPGEIRNQILRLILCPGHIQLGPKTPPDSSLTAPESSPKKTKSSVKKKRSSKKTGSPSKKTIHQLETHESGFRLLATCRQLREEGRQIYWSENTFHAPAGPYEVTSKALKTIQPKNLIRHVSIRLSLLDLTPPKLNDIKDYAKAVENSLLVPLVGNFGKSMMISRCLESVLSQTWLQKIQGVKAALPELETISLEIRTKVKPLNTLRVVVPAKQHIAPPGYQFSFSISQPLHDPLDPHRFYSGEERILDDKTGAFLEFALSQARMRATKDITTHGFQTFMDSIDARFVETYDEEILGEASWSSWEWLEWQEKIKAVTEPTAESREELRLASRVY